MNADDQALVGLGKAVVSHSKGQCRLERAVHKVVHHSCESSEDNPRLANEFTVIEPFWTFLILLELLNFDFNLIVGVFVIRTKKNFINVLLGLIQVTLLILSLLFLLFCGHL